MSSSDESDGEALPFSPPSKRPRAGGDEGAGPSGDCRAAFSDEEEEKEEKVARADLLKQIDTDIQKLLEEGQRIDKKEEILRSSQVATVQGRDGAVYTLEIFLRPLAACRSRRERAGRADKSSPIVKDREGGLHAIIPSNHKLLLLCTRTATSPRQHIPRGSFVLFKFYVDGEALSEGSLHEATVKAPNKHWAKAHIDTHPVQDGQRVEFAHQANAFVGTFVVKVYTKLRESRVVEQFSAVPEDDRVLERTKRRICCAAPPEEAGGPAKVVRKFDTPESGLVETGLPVASIEVSYDDLVGTRARHWGQREFQVPALRAAGVSESMLREAFPGGIPGEGVQGGTIDLTGEQEVKPEIKEEE